MRLKNLVLILATLAMLVGLAACSSAGQSSEQGGGDQEQAPKEEQAQKQDAPKKMTKEAKSKQVAPKAGTGEEPGKEKVRIKPPKDDTLKLTVPKMEQIKNDTIPVGLGTDEALLRDYAAVHLKYTGHPWDEVANVYIAGHRIGFPGTNSNMAFYDLEDLGNGDKVFLTDADGNKYTYEVFRKMIVEPTNLSVLRPVPGKNIVTLQTCTLPDYTDRVVYQAELKDIKS